MPISFTASFGRFTLIRLLLLLVILSTAVPSLAAVGRTAGQFSVGGSGAASYSIPIFTPPGPRGVQPSVALAYSSSAGVGYMGRGWTVAGFSTISRCNKTVTQDGYATPIGLSPLDGYCIDGNRLRLQSGTYGQAGSVWSTEIADFSRITANGTQSALSGTLGGPESWTVERKDGTTWTYGTTTDSRVAAGDYDIARMWLLRQMQDRAGNKVVFTYEAQDGTTVGTTHPIKIEWTQTSYASGTYVYSMEFEYSSAGNPTISSAAGFLASATIRDTDLLTSVSVKTSGTTVRKYVLAYETSPTTGAKRLITVTECSDAGASDCLAATTIGYQNGQAGLESSPSFSTSISSSISSSLNGKLDVNGDGIKDLTYYLGGVWCVRLGSVSGYGSEISTGSDELYLSYGDPYGTGHDAVLGRISGTWYVFRWNGSSFSAVSTGVSGPDYMTLVDVDGDGRDDLVSMDYYSGMITTLPSTSSGTTLSFGSPQYAPYPFGTPSAGILSPHYDRFDLNGDGRDDLIAYYAFGGGAAAQMALMTGDNYQFWPAAYVPHMAYPAIGPTNLNGDKCQDLYVDYSPYLSKCLGSVLSSALGGSPLGQGDWNGDTRPDTFVLLSGNLHVQIADGESLQSAQSVTLPSGCAGWFIDANGDDLEDYVCRNGTTLYTYLHNSSTVLPDLATSFTDGFGVTQSVSYVISTHAGYTPYSTASYPQRDVVEPRLLVRTVTESDGVGGTYSKTYSYFGATEDSGRRAGQGFEKIEMVDSRNSVKLVRKFERAFPYSGSMVEESIYQPGGTLMSSQSSTMAYTALDATSYNQRYFIYPSGSIADAYEVGGAKNGDWIARTAVSNTFDTSGNLTASTKVVTDKDTSSPLYGHYWTEASAISITPNTTYWCLGLPSSTSVTGSSSISGETTVVRSKGFSPDYVNCRQNAESVGSGNRQVDTNYTYGDSFGNVTSVSVTGRNPNGTSMTARTSSTSFGTTGQFPVSETNALSQTTTRTFHSTFGSLLTETDPNSIVVATNTYDAFGRLIGTTKADGTYSTVTFGTPGSGKDPRARSWTSVLEYGSDNSSLDGHTYYLDAFDRSVSEYHYTTAGSGYNAITRGFDSQGRLAWEGAPFYATSGNQYTPAHSTTYSYDLAGRLISQSRPQSQSVSTPVTTTIAYEGHKQTVTDPNNKVSIKSRDVNGWMRYSQDHDNYYQQFSYNGAGSLMQVADRLSNVLFDATYSYGAKAFQDSSTDMDLGATTYYHNSLGELTSWTDAKSQSFSQTYDALSRVTSRTEAEGTTTWSWGTSAGSHNIGRLDYVLMPSLYGQTFTYDSVGRVSQVEISTDQLYYIDYAYNNQGLLDTLTYPTSTSGTRVKVKHGYSYGILQSVTDWTSGSAGTVYWTANTQNVRGQTTQETLGNGVVTNRSFDAVTGWMNSIQSGVSGGTGLQNLSYLYDTVGNVTQRQESTLGLTENFYYDNLYRLDYSQLNSTTNLDLTYDAMGNITNRTDVNGNATWTYHGTKKHAVATTGSGGISYSYDANGNMTSRGGQSISWSSYNYPTQLNTATESTNFYYGPDRQYYKQVYTGPSVTETTHYVGGLLEKVYDGTTTDWRHSIMAEGQVVAIVSRKSSGTNAVNYPLEDNQGSGSVLTNSSGTNLVRQSYNAFGLPRDGADWDGAEQSGDQSTIDGISRRGYTGHSMLGAMGLIHMNGRVQDAVTGRFLSPDPNIPDPGFTQSYNRFAYVNNSPLSYIDPTGFLNAFLQEMCMSGWNPIVQQTMSQEQCFGAMSFSEAMDSGYLLETAMWRQERSGCPETVGDCNAWNDDRIEEQRRNRARPGGAGAEVSTDDASAELNNKISGDGGGGAVAGQGGGVLGGVGRGGIGSRGAQSPAGLGTPVVRVGERLTSVYDALANPNLLKGLNPSQASAQMARPGTWRTETLGQGAHKGEGYVLREYLANGEASGRMLRWHPGGGHHGPDPYWTVTQPNSPTTRVPGGR